VILYNGGGGGGGGGVLVGGEPAGVKHVEVKQNDSSTAEIYCI
jgi:hypothetical protein